MFARLALYDMYNRMNRTFDWAIPIGDLFIRFWIAKIFFISGLTKIQSWHSTIMLFEHEYEVPLLSSYWAALSGTTIELVMPVLLLLGLGGRLPALILFIFNVVAVCSYPFLLTEAGEVGLKDHIYWGILLSVVMLHGPGRITLDHYIFRYMSRNKESN